MIEIQIFAITLLPLLVASLVVLLVNWRIHLQMRGPGHWALGAASRLVGVLMIAMSESLPPIFSDVLGYLLVIVGDFIAVQGLCLFANRPPYKRTSIGIILVALLGFGYYSFSQPDAYYRVIILIAGHIISIFLLVLVQWRIARQDGVGGILILAFSSFWEMFLSPLLLLMMYLAWGNAEIELAIGWVQPMSATAMLGILQTFGFMLLTANRTQRELRQMALLDTLTGVPNRRAFDAAVKRALEVTRRGGTRLGLIVIDIDHFKWVNDTHGHSVGDALLRHVAATVSSTLRDSDFFARIGGEEFALVVEDTAPDTLFDVAERLRVAVADTPLQRAHDSVLSCTLSAGIALSEPGQVDFNQLYAAADTALYRAKTSGRNRVELADVTDLAEAPTATAQAIHA